MKRKHLFPLVICMLLLALLLPVPARADMAPPQQPPGAAIMPGAQTTQVRMLAETVTMTVLTRPSANYPGQAKTQAVFTMHNTGSAAETMQARFPLTFWNDESDGMGRYPEIQDIRISVNGKTIPTTRVQQTYTPPGGIARQLTPWAAFDVTFPPGQDVTVTVDYTTNGYGYEPDFTLRYILETGAGWYGTIGSADIVVNLPYPASPENVIVDAQDFAPQTSAGAQFSTNQVRWHLSDFEPTADNNIVVSLVIPSVWQKVLDWRAQVIKTPADGEAWGQLGKAIKESMRITKGFLRDGPTADKLMAESSAAYQKSVSLLPKDALWHYGYADLLWIHHFNDQAAMDRGDYTEIAKAVDQLRQSLALDPKNQDALNLALWISGSSPGVIAPLDPGPGYDFLVLTATPEAPTSSASSSASASSVASATAETPIPVTSASGQPIPAATGGAPGSPLCGSGVAWTLPFAAFILWRRRPNRR